MGRLLTPLERMLVVMSDGATLNACVISRVRGPLTEARLTEALSNVQRRHPLLRVRIVDGRSYTEEGVPAIPLRVVDCDEHETNAVVERELSEPFAVERGPLIRVSWLQHKPDLGTLVFTFHHVIGDGVSSGVFVRDLIGAAAGTLNLPYRSLDTVAPLEEMLPARLRGWRGDWSFLRLFARSLWRAATKGRPSQLRVARWVPPAERTIHVLGRSLNSEFVGALAEKARAEHTGLHGALAAAICMAVAGDERDANPTSVLLGSTVDVRDQLEPAMGEEFGFYVGFSQFWERIDPSGDLWEVARQVQAELVRDRQDLGPLKMIRMVRLGMKLSGMGRRSTAEVANRFAQARPVTGGLSFVQSLPQARLSIEPKVGRLEIETLHFTGAPSAMGDMTFAASLFAGRLHLNAMWPEPAIDELQANSIVDDVIARLEAAVSWTQWGGRSTYQIPEQTPAPEALWRKELRGFSSPASPSVGRTAGDLLTQEFDCGEIAISQSGARQLQTQAEVHGLNLRTLAHGALALLLSRYFDDENVVFSVRVEGPPPDLPGAGTIVGPFANSRPLQVRVSPDTRVIDWLKQIQSRYEEICRHQYDPVDQTKEWSALPEGLPVFEIEIAEFTLKLTYDRNRFDEETVARMLNHLRTILEGIAAQPEQTVHTVPLLDQQEYRQFVTEPNDTDIGYPQDQCIHWMFEAQAEQMPEIDAVVVGADRLSYGALNERANQLAHHLRSLGVGPEVRVAICVERSFDMLVGIIGILKAGGAYVPLDPSYPAERLAFMLEDAQASVLLTQERLEDQLPAHLGTVVFLDSDWSQISQCDTTNPDSGVGGDNLAYVIYTSGSTGKPKGVMVTHRGICNTSEAMVRVFDLPPGTRMLQFGSLSFDMAVFDIIPAIISGGTLVLAPQTPPTGQDLLELVREQDIQVLTLPPSVLATLPFEDLPHLQFVRVAGEPISSELAALWSPGRRFYNAYGPAEGSVWVSGAYLDGTSISAIGAPISNTKLYVLNSQQSPVPVGVPGELCIGGISVSRGYLNRPEITAERFIPDPFSEQPGMRLYRTGDLARYWPNGDLEFLGRKDHQVKLHGVRIELGEIESILRKHPAVREAATLLREDVPGKQRLVGYVLPKDGEKPAPQDLRNFLAEILPATMVPTAFVILDKLPLTPNGKLDLRALPPPPSQGFNNEAGYVAPRNEVEKKLAGIWAEVLGKDVIGVHDNFFDLGGYSLLAMQVASRICSAFDVELSLPRLFEATTVAQVSELITNIKPSSEIPQQPLATIARDTRDSRSTAL
ncbi:MAG TPA: amino acid adenylation domain-containing protein [Pyrinomonadaceae bacterium]|nr:amino acid adenylation domain-containing protein [Pyrinomonadaceae bacterium]